MLRSQKTSSRAVRHWCAPARHAGRVLGGNLEACWWLRPQGGPAPTLSPCNCGSGERNLPWGRKPNLLQLGFSLKRKSRWLGNLIQSGTLDVCLGASWQLAGACGFGAPSAGPAQPLEATSKPAGRLGAGSRWQSWPGKRNSLLSG